MGRRYYVYWIHKKEQTDMFSQGYIGISYRPPRRFYEHSVSKSKVGCAIRKYSLSEQNLDIICVSDIGTCLELEYKLRPNKYIGWNLTEGGGLPPSTLGKKYSKHSRDKMSKAQVDKGTNKYSYRIYCPNGEVIEIGSGYCIWCREQGICESKLREVAKGYRKQHKGYTAEFL